MVSSYVNRDYMYMSIWLIKYIYIYIQCATYINVVPVVIVGFLILDHTEPIRFRRKANTARKQPYPRYQGQNRSLESLTIAQQIHKK